MVDFFIRRPIFATVIALIIILAGAVSIPTLPLAEYPEISPPKVSVTSTYTGASSQVVESAVTTPLEQQINGAQNIKYITSTSGNDGTSTINVTFDLERDIDLAAVDIQNRISAAQGRLPEEVKRTGVTVNKVSNSFVLAIGILTPDNRYSSQFLSNYADIYIRDALKRVKGVGDVRIFGERKYSMRVWLDPHKLANKGITAQEVVTAINDQNIQVAAGQIGQAPLDQNQMFQMSVRAVGRLKKASEFENIIIRSGKDGQLVRIKDVGRAELGAEDYQNVVRFRGKDAVGIGVFQRPGSNALEIATGVRAEMERLAKRFPPGMTHEFAFDTTRSVKESIKEVIITLLQAIGLVVLVIFLFLQSFRSTLIPVITIPVSLIGTFAVMKVLGFSINTLSLFGITLATGLVVDDAIVVIENITRLMHERGINAREASSLAMREVTGAVIAISLVLGAVFIPVAFFPGTTGQLYKQFALTIAISVAISTLNALTLTPALSALWLKKGNLEGSKLFAPVNWLISLARSLYTGSLGLVLKVKALVLIGFVALLGCTYWLTKAVPTAFIPDEDVGYMIIIVQAPEGVSINYTVNVLKKIEKELEKCPEIVSSFGVGGFSFTGTNPNNAIVFSSLKDWHERHGEEHSLRGVINRLRGPLSTITEATIIPFNPPAIQGLGNFGGFVFELQDMFGTDIGALADVTKQVMMQAGGEKQLTGVFSPFTANSPQLITEIMRDKARALKVLVADIFGTMEIMLGSRYVNDFDLGNRIYRVYVQADQLFRSNPRDIDGLYVRSQTGEMISLANLVKVERTTAPQTISHYNLFRSAEVNGSAAPGISSGQAITAMESLAKRVLPQGMSYEWSGISLEEKESGPQTFILFALGIVVVFLVLAAQYESFVDPVIILLSVPLAMLGALLSQWLRHLDNDVFCQIGLVMLVGLASKNAILIVEFANHLRAQGKSVEDAVREACAIRFRPILMTSLAFVFGILPLVFATGAGAHSRQSLGTAVCGGMVLSTVLSLYIVPVIYVVVKRLAGGRVKPHGEEHELDPAGHDGAPGATETGEVVAVSDSGVAEK
ncbi:MAG: multidrug efflux RND transporter permease subunit [Candidatus Obscuribacter sp.]|nr:multidrug efflux RND transporter permease subunit [Candidatus Obscuribacter sp.]MBP6348017.1 multidrug efflux RND transporter permease subunit [Candidatus Obscuribacter sp.]